MQFYPLTQKYLRENGMSTSQDDFYHGNHGPVPFLLLDPCLKRPGANSTPALRNILVIHGSTFLIVIWRLSPATAARRESTRDARKEIRFNQASLFDNFRREVAFCLGEPNDMSSCLETPPQCSNRKLQFETEPPPFGIAN